MTWSDLSCGLVRLELLRDGNARFEECVHPSKKYPYAVMISHLNLLGYRIFGRFQVPNVSIETAAPPLYITELLMSGDRCRRDIPTTSEKQARIGPVQMPYFGYNSGLRLAPHHPIVAAFWRRDLLEEETVYHGEEDRRQRKKKGGHGVSGL